MIWAEWRRGYAHNTPTAREAQRSANASTSRRGGDEQCGVFQQHGEARDENAAKDRTRLGVWSRQGRPTSVLISPDTKIGATALRAWNGWREYRRGHSRT